MMVKFHSRGTGRGSGPVGYLLGKDRDRDGAELLRGDPDSTEQLIDSLKFAKRYTSGVLSFAEQDVSPDVKAKIMDTFERAMMPGLDADQYQCLWVEHQDKGRLELNFVVPNVELTTGKRLQPYYDKADRPRINAWKDITNAVFKLHDPNDPANRQALTIPSDLPRASQEASKAITEGLMAMAGAGAVTSREDVLRALQEGGLTIARETKRSISIENPSGGRNIRLKGALYERDFKLGPELRAEVEAASREYRESTPERVREAREVYQRGVELKRADNQRRYQRPQPEIERVSPQGVAMDRTERVSGVEREFRGVVVDGREDQRELDRAEAAKPSPQTGQSQDLWPPADRGQKRALYRASEGRRGSQRLDSRRQESIETRGLAEHDRTRDAAIERIRGVTERLRSAASGVAERLRGLAGDVRAQLRRDSGLAEAGQQLGKSGRQLEQTAKVMVKQRERGPSLGR